MPALIQAVAHDSDPCGHCCAPLAWLRKREENGSVGTRKNSRSTLNDCLENGIIQVAIAVETEDVDLLANSRLQAVEEVIEKFVDFFLGRLRSLGDTPETHSYVGQVRIK